MAAGFLVLAMGKLTNLSSPLGGLRPLIGAAPRSEQERNQHRDRAQAWRKWYRIARWKALRIKIFKRDLFTCRMCARLEGKTSQLVCDHIKPHRGNAAMFWNEDNLQTLCKRCHDTEKQKAEQDSRHHAGQWD